MKSAEKIFDALEYVILQNGSPVTPGMAAEALALPPATAVRLLQQLTARGYLVQVSRKRGYVPGPMCVSLRTRQNAYSMLAEAAEEPLRKLSEFLKCKINLAVLHGTSRVMLNIHIPENGPVPWKRFLFRDHWSTATGRILLASLNENEARRICEACGIEPFPYMELKNIRESGSVCFLQDGLSIIGQRILIAGCPAAAFGFGVSPEKSEEAFSASAAAAAEIREKLTAAEQAY